MNYERKEFVGDTLKVLVVWFIIIAAILIGDFLTFHPVARASEESEAIDRQTYSQQTEAAFQQSVDASERAGRVRF